MHLLFLLLFIFASVDGSIKNKIKTKTEDEIRNSHHHRNHGHQCYLNGFWYNQLGSELYVNMTNENKFCGTFRTLKKLESSTITELTGKVRGMVNGKLFVFNVFWPDGNSSTVWTGQCHKPCNMGFWSMSRYTLHATWIVNSKVDSCVDHWKAMRIGQDIFARDVELKRVSDPDMEKIQRI